MNTPKTIVTARYTNPGHRNTSPDYTERRVSFDLHLSARVCELVGFGLLWEMGLAPVPEFAEVSSEHHDGGCGPAADLRRPAPFSVREAIREAGLAVSLSSAEAIRTLAAEVARLRSRNQAEREVQAVVYGTLFDRLCSAEADKRRVRVHLLHANGSTSTSDGIPHLDGDNYVQLRHPDALDCDNDTPWCSIVSEPEHLLPTIVDVQWSAPADAVAGQAVENAAKIAELTAWLSTNAGDDARAGEHGVDVALRLLKRHYAPGRAKLPEGWRRLDDDATGPRIAGPDGERVETNRPNGAHHVYIRDDCGNAVSTDIAALRAYLALLDAECAPQ